MTMDIFSKHHVSRGGPRHIPLTKGQVAIVDAEDYDRLARHKWRASTRRDRCYAQRTEHGKTIQMHREILHVPAGLLCDHRNHNGLDNRKCNLRICTASQNGQNRRPLLGGTSRYKGVWLDRTKGKWRAVICHRGHKRHIGYYDYEADAAIAYDDWAIELFGEFAYLNFQCRPEIKEWLDQTFFFPPTRHDPTCFGQDGPEPQAIPLAVACGPERMSDIVLCT